MGPRRLENSSRLHKRFSEKNIVPGYVQVSMRKIVPGCIHFLVRKVVPGSIHFLVRKVIPAVQTCLSEKSSSGDTNMFE